MPELSGFLDNLHERRRRLGLLDMPQEDAERRIRALVLVPPDAFMRLVAIQDDELREAEIQAIVRGYRAPEAPIQVERRLCAARGCDEWFIVPANRPDKQYCSDLCRNRSGRERRM